MKKQEWIISVGFWGIFFLCFWQWIDPRLIYFAFGRVLPYPEFEWNREFAERILSNPGGVVQWAAGLLSQSFINPWFGSIVITAVAAILSWEIGQLIPTRNRLRKILSFLPALIILAAYSRYIHPLTICPVIIIGTGAALLFRRIYPKTTLFQWFVYSCICLFVYYAGATAAWLLCALALISELRRKKYVLSAGILGITPVIMIALGNGLSGWSWDQSLLYLLPFSEGWAMLRQNITLAEIQLLWIWPLFVLIIDLFAVWISSRRRQPRFRAVHGTSSMRWNRLIPGYLTVLLFALIPITVKLSRHPLAADQLRIITLAEDKRWADVLDHARRLPKRAWNVYVNYEVNRALLHSGQMGEKLFAYPQSLQGLLLMAEVEPGDPELAYNVDLLVELGCANMAEHAAMELLEVKGNCPFLLDQLARIYLVKGSPTTASVFLGKLKSIPSFRYRADVLLKMIASDAPMNNHQEIQRLRACMSDEDIVTFDLDADQLFGNLLDHNPDNRAAFEYRMTYYLLTQQVNKLVANLGGLQRFGLTQLPRHYAEALAIYLARGGANVRLGQLQFPEEYNQQARAFLAQYNLLKGDRAIAMKGLAAEYGDSYFYYYTFGVSGVR